MARKRYEPEEIMSLLRHAAVLHGQGMTMADAIRQLGVGGITSFRWRKDYGGMCGDQLPPHRACGDAKYSYRDRGAIRPTLAGSLYIQRQMYRGVGGAWTVRLSSLLPCDV